MGLKVGKNTILANFWSILSKNSLSSIHNPHRIIKNPEIKNQIVTLCFIYPKVDTYQFLGHLKNSPQTRYNIRPKYYHKERSAIQRENPSIPFKHIFQKCLKKILKNFFATQFSFIRTPFYWHLMILLIYFYNICRFFCSRGEQGI